MGILQGKKGLIFGALDAKSIAWITAQKCFAEGAQLVLTNAPVAVRMGSIKELAKNCGDAPVIAADITNQQDIEQLILQTKEHFGGGFDFILHSVGMSLNMRKNRSYTELDYDFMHKTLDISAMSLHRILSTCLREDALCEAGSVVTLSYVAAQRVFPDYSEMAEAKALLESIVRSFGYHYGIKKRVRINSVSQSPTITTAGSGVKGFDGFMDFAEKMSPLGNASAEDCAAYCATLFSDYTKMVTMQNLYHDGGYSSTGVSHKLL